MERLREAIKKARADRQGQIGQTSRGEREHTLETAEIDGRERRPDISYPTDRDDGRSGADQAFTSQLVHVNNETLREQRVIAASEHDHRVEPYRQLRTQILRLMQDNGWRTLAITSANEGAGKTLTSVNLAISLSRHIGTTVLLVDLDLRTPTVHEKLGLDPDKGLVDFLEERAALEEILFDPGLNQLIVLAGRSAGKFSSELLASPRMKSLMDDLCQTGEAGITIFDLPPLLRNDDALLFTPYVDATLVVVEDGITTEEQLKQSMRLLQNANVVGTILNKARV